MADRNITPKDGLFGIADIAATTTLYRGDFVIVDASYNAVATGGVRLVGVAVDPPIDSDYNNATGAAGDKRVRYRRHGVFNFNKSAVHAPVLADVGKPVYAEDLNTVSTDPSDGFGLFAGRITDVDDSFVWVDIDPAAAPAPGELGATTYAALQTLLAAEALVFNVSKKYYPVIGQGGAVILSADFPDGDHAGQEIVIVGTSATNTVTIPSGINTKTTDEQPVTLGLDDVAGFFWSGTTWIEWPPRSIVNAAV